MLNKLDIKILTFISKFDKISIDDILKKFPEDKFSTKLRLKILIKERIISYEKTVIKVEYLSLPTNNGVYFITLEGKKFIQDRKIKKQQRRIDDFRIALQHIITTIIISFITASITAYFKLS